MIINQNGYKILNNNKIYFTGKTNYTKFMNVFYGNSFFPDTGISFDVLYDRISNETFDTEIYDTLDSNFSVTISDQLSETVIVDGMDINDVISNELYQQIIYDTLDSNFSVTISDQLSETVTLNNVFIFDENKNMSLEYSLSDNNISLDFTIIDS